MGNPISAVKSGETAAKRFIEVRTSGVGEISGGSRGFDGGGMRVDIFGLSSFDPNGNILYGGSLQSVALGGNLVHTANLAIGMGGSLPVGSGVSLFGDALVGFGLGVRENAYSSEWGRLSRIETEIAPSISISEFMGVLVEGEPFDLTLGALVSLQLNPAIKHPSLDLGAGLGLRF